MVDPEVYQTVRVRWVAVPSSAQLQHRRTGSLRHRHAVLVLPRYVQVVALCARRFRTFALS